MARPSQTQQKPRRWRVNFVEKSNNLFRQKETAENYEKMTEDGPSLWQNDMTSSFNFTKQQVMPL